jgi:hypothetical protein
MAEKRKSWQKHDFEKRREERQSNEDADILSFEFHSLKKQRGRDDRDRDREFDRNRDRDRGRDRDRDRDKGRDRDRDRDKGRDRDRGRNRDWKSQDGDDDYRHQFKGKSYKSRDERQEDRKKFFQKKK